MLLNTFPGNVVFYYMTRYCSKNLHTHRLPTHRGGGVSAVRGTVRPAATYPYPAAAKTQNVGCAYPSSLKAFHKDHTSSSLRHPPSVPPGVSPELKLLFLHQDASKDSTGFHKSHNRCYGEGKCSLYPFFLYM